MNHKVSAIVPAFNEEANIGRVLEVLSSCPLIDEIIVVDDGSTDGTSRVVMGFRDVHLIHLEENRGKANAIYQGIRGATGDILLFVDADLVGLTSQHIEVLVEPVFLGTADMTLGIFHKGRVPTDMAQKIAPELSGQRAIRRECLNEFPFHRYSGYQLEVALTRWAQKRNLRIQKVSLEGVTHRTKEEKMGPSRGILWRLQMYWDILRALVKRV